jgi:nicotinamidase/pyrazinamidase
MDKKCLIIIDVQNDFCPEGSLEVPEGDEIIPVINKISSKFFKVVATQDWHPINHVSFASTHNKNPGDVINVNGIEQILWTDHCVQSSIGANFHEYFNLNHVNMIIKKGSNPEIDSYSAFFENDKKTETGLEYFLKGLKITDVYLCGLATDYCVFYSAMDAKRLGFNTFVIINASKGVDKPAGNLEKTIAEMKSNGIKLIEHTQLL